MKLLNNGNWFTTDDSTGQKVRHLEPRVYQVLEAGEVHLVDLDYYTDEELDACARPYYEGGLDEIRRGYPDDSDLILAEIIAETESI